MNKLLKIKYLILGVVFLGTLFFLQCDPDDPIGVSCEDCFTRKPDTAYLYIELTINNENWRVPFWLYEGEPEEANLILADTFAVSSIQFLVPVGRHFSAKAEYKKGSKTIVAFDGDDLETRKVSGECATDCYVISGDNINLTLK